MRKSFAVLLLIFISFSAQSQQLEWVKSLGGGFAAQTRSIQTDAAGNVYTTGYFQGGFYMVPENFSNLIPTFGGDDIFVMKFSPTGTFLWGKSFGGTSSDRASSLAVDASGNVIVTGYFSGTADFDPSAASYPLTSAGSQDIFIVKLSTDGAFQWAKRIGSTLADVANSVCTDAQGNIFATGWFQGTVDFNPGTGTQNFTAASYDIFILKLDANGNYVWNIKYGSSPAEQGREIVCDQNGNIYTSGSYASTIDFNLGIEENFLFATGIYDAYILKLTNDGDFIWVNKIGGVDNEFIESMAVDNAGGLIVGGNYKGTVDFDPGAGVVSYTASNNSTNGFIANFGADGTFGWAKSIGNSGNDEVSGVSVDLNNNVYATGFFQGSVDLNTNEGVDDLYSAVAEDAFLVKLNSNGNYIRAFVFHGDESEYGYSVINDAQGNTYTCGFYTGTVDFDPGNGIVNKTSNGDFDFYFLKLGACTSVNSTDTRTSCGAFTWIDGNTYTSNTNSATYSLVSSSGCDSIVTLNLTVNSVNVNVTDNAPTLQANATNAQYQWLNCNANFAVIPGATNQSFTATTSGSYAVKVTQNACSDTSSCYILNSVGINSIVNNSSISIYPNPSASIFTIDFQEPFQQLELRIMNSIGQEVDRQLFSNNHQVNFAINDKPGVYFVEMTTNSAKKEVFRLVKLELN